jgi:hypothetical protein
MDLSARGCSLKSLMASIEQTSARHNASGTALLFLLLVGAATLAAQDAVVQEENRSQEIIATSDPKAVAALDAAIPPSTWVVHPGQPAPSITQAQVQAIMDKREQSTTSQVCDYRFLDATNDGKYELIAFAQTGRDCDMYVTRRAQGFYTTQAFSAPTTGLTSAINDLDGDGVPELVIPFGYGSSAHGIDPKPTWTAIYRWNGTQYAAADSLFPAFYQARLATLNATIQKDEANPNHSTEMYQEDASCDYMERDRILRHLGIDPNAGLTMALQWANGTDSILQDRAATVLADLAPSVYLTPTAASLHANQSQEFIASVAGMRNTDVTWSLSPNVGTMADPAIYTAPVHVASNQTVKITATSVADKTKSASAVVTLKPLRRKRPVRQITPGPVQ